MNDRTGNSPLTDIFCQLTEAEALARIRQVAETRWKINRALNLMEKMASHLEAAQVTPALDYQALERALAGLESLFQQEAPGGCFAHELARFGIQVRRIQAEQRQLQLAWHLLAAQLQRLVPDSLRALYDAVPALKEEVDRISARLRPVNDAPER